MKLYMLVHELFVSYVHCRAVLSNNDRDYTLHYRLVFKTFSQNVTSIQLIKPHGIYQGTRGQFH